MDLQVIMPPHLKVASTIENPLEIVPEAKEILRKIRKQEFAANGAYWTDCYAMAQPQVSNHPLRYFVLNDSNRNPDYGRMVKEYGSAVIVNPHLEHKDKTSRVMFKDACMSYPFRPVVKVKRFTEIDVSYDIISDIEGTPKVEKIRNKHLSGLAALVFLHELEHLNGKSIYT